MYKFYSETCVLGIFLLYIVPDIGARERKSGQVNQIFNKILISSYDGDIPGGIVKIFSQRMSDTLKGTVTQPSLIPFYDQKWCL